MAKLPTAFKKDGTVTAGNASGINDAAGAFVVTSAEWAEKKGLKPLATIVGYATAALDPAYMGMGPYYATKKVLEKTGMKLRADGRHRGQRGLRRPKPLLWHKSWAWT